MNGNTIVPDLLIRVVAESIQIFLGMFFNPLYGFFKYKAPLDPPKADSRGREPLQDLLIKT